MVGNADLGVTKGAVIDPDEVRQVAMESIRLKAETARLNELVSAMTLEMQTLQARAAEWEKFFYEHKAARDEGYEAARARYWPKVAAARSEILLLKTSLQKLIEAARDAPSTPALGSMIVSAEFALSHTDRPTPDVPET